MVKGIGVVTEAAVSEFTPLPKWVHVFISNNLQHVHSFHFFLIFLKFYENINV